MLTFCKNKNFAKQDWFWCRNNCNSTLYFCGLNITLISTVYLSPHVFTTIHIFYQTLSIWAKTPWSWGRTYGVLSEGRKIESRRQLEQYEKSNELETTQNAGPWTTTKTRGRAFLDWTRSKALKWTKKRLNTRDVNWRKRENRARERESSVSRHEAFPRSSCSTKNKPGWSLLHWMLPKQPCIRRDGEKK